MFEKPDPNWHYLRTYSKLWRGACTVFVIYDSPVVYVELAEFKPKKKRARRFS